MGARVWRYWALGYAIVVLFASGLTAAVAMQSATSVDEWDPRVEPLVAFVERERDLKFDHPVAVEFVDDDDFAGRISGDEGIPEADAEEAAQAARLFRALGLVTGDVDLNGSGTELVEEGTLALYDPDTERILVRGTELDVGRRATLVHELTHALQDQHFDLKRILEVETSGEEFAFRALAEGDADRVETIYVEGLSESDQQVYETTSGDVPELPDVPAALVSYFSAPYVLGDSFVGLVQEIEGRHGIDRAFENPPTSDESLLDPLTYLASDEPRSVDLPALGPGEEEFDGGDFGALSWLLMLGARLDPHEALAAVDGWGGDGYVAYERSGTACARLAFVGDSAADTDQMATALRRWVDAAPGRSSSVRRAGDGVELDACDPGPQATVAFPPGYADILVLPVARADITRGFMSRGAAQTTARCIAQLVVDGYTVEQLADPDGSEFENPRFERRMNRIVESCR